MRKLIAPVILVMFSLLSLLHPRLVITALVFEPLAVPFGSALDSFRYQDKPFLTPLGTVIVGVVWAIILYVVISLVGMIRKHIKRGDLR